MNDKRESRKQLQMPQSPNAQIIKKIERLSQIAEALRKGKHFPITRLTTLKSLCGDPEAAPAFALIKVPQSARSVP
jgi:hypothetical protein